MLPTQIRKQKHRRREKKNDEFDFEAMAKVFAKYSFSEVMGAAEMYVGAYGGKYFPDEKEIFDLIRPDPLASFDRFIRWRYHMEDRTDLRLDQLLLEVDYLECRTRPVEVGDDAS